MDRDHPGSALTELLHALSEISLKGPISSVGRGDTAVGMTLLSELGIPYTSTKKNMFKGIAITSSRRNKPGMETRLNLVTKVPDWSLSGCSSSREIVETYGYLDSLGGHKLYCTVKARIPNSQGLFLEVDRITDTLREMILVGPQMVNVATWRLEVLRERLSKNHPESVWVRATASKVGNDELFHFREAVYTGPPNIRIFPELLEEGTITMDHLILEDVTKGGQVTEKGPTFKIDPGNLGMLFPAPMHYDLMDAR